MPVTDVHSAANSGQLAPSFRATGEDDRRPAARFHQLLRDELAGEGGDEAIVRNDATAAAISTDRAPIASGANRAHVGSGTPLLASRAAPLQVDDGAAPFATAATGPADDAIVAPGEVVDAGAMAEPAQPATAPPTGSNATMAPRPSPASVRIGLGSGPVLSAAVTDGLTPIADADPGAPSSEDSPMLSSGGATTARQGTVASDLDGPAAEIADPAGSDGAAAAALMQLVAVTHGDKAIGSTPTEPTVAPGKLASASLVARAPAGVRQLIDAADAVVEEPGQAKGAELGDRSASLDLAANRGASAGTHRAEPSLPPAAIPFATGPAAVAAAPVAQAVLGSGPAETDAAALHHVERLYAPHEGAKPSASTGAFARLGTIGQDTGVALARGVSDGRDHVAIRLDPPDLGRIDVRLSFGQDGGLRAVVASDNHAALDLLRRDLDQLQRALADAGVRADAQSFHFSERQSGGSQRWDAPVTPDQRYAAVSDSAAERSSVPPPPRRLRSSGLIDVFA